MKKSYIIAILVLLLVLSFGVFMMKGKKQVDTPVVKNEEQNTSLKDLLLMGKSQKCSFDKGIIYIASGKFRGDFDGKSHMIVDGNTSYIWTDDQNVGFKMNFDIDSKPESSQSNNFDYTKKADYKCEYWGADISMFTTPNNIQFQEFKNLTLPTGGKDIEKNTSQCGYCDSLTGEEKSQCLTALSCN